MTPNLKTKKPPIYDGLCPRSLNNPYSSFWTHQCRHTSALRWGFCRDPRTLFWLRPMPDQISPGWGL